MSATASAPASTLDAQIDRLIATRDPKDALAAYQLLADCASFNRDGDRLIFDAPPTAPWKNEGSQPGFRALSPAEKIHDAALCPGMSERMRMSRIDYLAIAARAGVPGAAVLMAGEGPFGDPTALLARPDDPLVQAWKQEVLTLLRSAADDADLGALEYISVNYLHDDALFGKDPALAYRYGLARGLIYRDLLSPGETLFALYAPDGAQMTGIGAELSATQRNEALAAATRIADLARLRQQQAGAR